MIVRDAPDQDITRKPYFLADGDIIGYMILPKNQGLPDKEDFQSAEDREWRQALAVAMEKQGRRFTKESNFKLNIDF